MSSAFLKKRKQDGQVESKGSSRNKRDDVDGLKTKPPVALSACFQFRDVSLISIGDIMQGRSRRGEELQRDRENNKVRPTVRSRLLLKRLIQHADAFI